MRQDQDVVGGASGRGGPGMIQAAGLRAAAPDIAAGLLAFAVWQGQGPVAVHFFAGPYERYERELARRCLAASLYRTDAVQTAYSSSPPPARERPRAWALLKTAARTRSGRWMPRRGRDSTASVLTVRSVRVLHGPPGTRQRVRQPACR